MNLPVMMAPMVGLSHVVFREVVRSYLPPNVNTIWPTEMLNSRRLPHEKVGSTFPTLKSENEKNLVPQILGNEKEAIQNSIKVLEKWGAVGIDINMGCPVQKALKHNYGVDLMGDVDYAAEVTRYAVEASCLPVSVKLRAGQQNDKEFLLNFVIKLQDAGASWICLHPRLASQKRRGRSDWSQISFIKKNLKIPVIGNGDIQISDDIVRMFNETSCDGVMLGRALTGRPWLLAKMAKILNSQLSLEFEMPQNLEEEAQEYGKSLKKFIYFSRKYFPDSEGLKRLRFLLRVSNGWLNFGHDLYSRAQKIESYDQADEVLDIFFRSKELKYSTYTSLTY
jgi:tRNA-dihydrouridine synthase B